MLRLRPYKSADARWIVTWVADHDAFSAWCADKLDWPLTEGALEKRQAECAGKPDRWLMTALDDAGTPVGFFMVIRADCAQNSMHIGMIIVDPAHRGQGLGTTFLRLILAYARDVLGMRRVTLRVFAHNTAALACYRKVGFQETTLEQGCFLHGSERWDCWNMEALL